MAVSPPSLKANEDDSENWMEKIFAREENICEFQDNARKAVTEIGKMCTDTIQKEFSLLKPQRIGLLKNSGAIWKLDILLDLWEAEKKVIVARLPLW